MKYILQKLGFYLIAFWAALTVNFFLPRLLPGNPVDIMLANLLVDLLYSFIDPRTRARS